MVDWNLSEWDFDQLAGIDFNFIRSGEIEIQAVDSPDNESISIPFLGYWPRYTYSTRFNFWDQYDLTVQERAEEELRFVNFVLAEDTNESYFLFLPELEIDPFIPLDGAQINLTSAEPFYQDDLDEVFTAILKDSYSLTNILEVELDVPDVLPLPQPVPTPVPEPTSVVTFVVFGVALLGGIVKRSIFQLKKRTPAYS